MTGLSSAGAGASFDSTGAGGHLKIAPPLDVAQPRRQQRMQAVALIGLGPFELAPEPAHAPGAPSARDTIHSTSTPRADQATVRIQFVATSR